MPSNNTIICPECEALFKFTGKQRTGQKFSCRRCHTTLIITGTKPLEVDVVRDKSADLRSPAKQSRKKGYALVKRPESNPISDASRHAADSTTAVCPECQDPIQLKVPPRLRQVIVCVNCDEVLQVVALKPVRLALVDEIDWS